jgi:suppressor for copper-sensitivity B
MLVVRQIAAAAIAGTAVWLLTVLASVSSLQIALLAGTSVGVIVWIVAVLRNRYANVIAAVLILALGGIAVVEANVARHAPDDAQTVNWDSLEPQKVQDLAHNGRTIFVDVGAAWCLTCKVNEALIAGSKEIQARLETDVIPVRGDWTKPNEKIAAYLKSFGRYGLPFNVVFGPGAPQGIVLPELLTEEAVLKAFDTASHKSITH